MNTTLTIRGVTVDVQYEMDGCYLAATEIDAAERPSVVGVTVSIMGEDITSLMSERVLGDIAERIERGVDEEAMPVPQLMRKQAGGVK